MAEMLRSEARIATPLAQRYLTQLCKHFEHRLAVRHEPGWGSIIFPIGLCRLEADRDVLILRAEVRDPPLLDQLEDVVARHLARFAFRERLQIVWDRTAAA